MSNELVINSTPNGDRIALLRDKSLIELHYENKEDNFTVGDIYLGIIRKVNPGMNAAFVDIGYDKDAFLHYSDMGPYIRSMMKFIRMAQNSPEMNPQLADFQMEDQTDKLGKIADILKVNQKVLVQVTKEPISTKGPRLSCELSLAGRYLVLVPFANSINVSKKIADQVERKRLHRLIASIKPENFGVIIRTVAEGKEVSELDRDLRDLLTKWQEGVKSLTAARPRQKVIGEMSKTASMLRDLLNESFDAIVVDDKAVYEEIRDYVQTIAPEKEKILKHYSGKQKIFEHYGIEKQMKTLFGQTVSLPSGGYIVIEHTEALHVIDVNSGNKSNSEGSQEETARKVNLEAAAEIARQLRLRDMGGIIVIDFIDMKKQEHRKQIYEQMRVEMQYDRSKYTILPLTKFGLMQITRQRVRPELNIVTHEKCPTCNGTGKVTATIAIADQITSTVDFMLGKQNEGSITLLVHPYLHAYFTVGFPSIRMKWFFRYKTWLKIVKDSSMSLTDFRFINGDGEEIQIQP